MSAISLGEIQNGISRLPDGQRKGALQEWLTNDLIPRFENRILPVTLDDMLLWGRLTGQAASLGKPLPTADAMLAATARNRCLTVVTRNERDFSRMGVELVNPWTKD